MSTACVVAALRPNNYLEYASDRVLRGAHHDQQKPKSFSDKILISWFEAKHFISIKDLAVSRLSLLLGVV